MGRSTRMGKIMTAALILFLMPALAAAAQVLTYSDHEPLGNMRTRFINDVFFAAIEKESNGRLTVAAHWNGKLATGYDALGLLGTDGAADMAMVVPEYAARQLPLHQLFKSFPVGPVGREQVEFLRRVYAEIPELSEELRKNQVVNLLVCTGYPVAFLSASPLTTLADLPGTTWRTASFWHQDFLRAAGINPITMPWGKETYEALASRRLDGIMVNLDSGYDLEAHRLCPHILVAKSLWLGHVYLLAMNRTTWDNLADEDRDALRRAAATASQSLGSIMEESFDALVETMRKDGAHIRIIEPEEVAGWKLATKYREAQDAWVKKQEDAGVTHAAAVLEALRLRMPE